MQSVSFILRPLKGPILIISNSFSHNDDDGCSVLHSKACPAFEFIVIASTFNSGESLSSMKHLSQIFQLADVDMGNLVPSSLSTGTYDTKTSNC